MKTRARVELISISSVKLLESHTFATNYFVQRWLHAIPYLLLIIALCVASARALSFYREEDARVFIVHHSSARRDDSLLAEETNNARVMRE
jgi:hypothetical protein